MNIRFVKYFLCDDVRVESDSGKLMIIGLYPDEEINVPRDLNVLNALCFYYNIESDLEIRKIKKMSLEIKTPSGKKIISNIWEKEELKNIANTYSSAIHKFSDKYKMFATLRFTSFPINEYGEYTFMILADEEVIEFPFFVVTNE